MVLEAENEGLKEVLARERDQLEQLIAIIDNADEARLEERAASDARIQSLQEQIRAHQRKQWIPGVIFGGGIGTDASRAEAVIGLGWKINIF